MTFLAAPGELRAHFRSLLPATHSSESADEVFNQLVCEYNASGRHYHNLGHIIACLRTARDFPLTGGLRPYPHVAELALFFHDIVYDPKRHDNEERSADIFMSAASELGVSSADKVLARECILATRHHREAVGPLEAYVVDVDLSILSEGPPVFDAYEKAIRAEYAHVPLRDFCIGRIAVLEHFLNRSRIFQTPSMYDWYEYVARHNIARSIDILKRLT